MNPDDTQIPETETPDKPENQATSDTPRIQTSDGNNARASFRFSLQHLNSAIAHCRPEVRQLVREGFLWCITHDITQEEWAKAIGMAPNTFYKFLTGKYKHPQTGVRLDLSDKYELAMRQWLKLQKSAFGASFGNGEFVMTPTAKKVAYACSIARESRTPVFLFGPSQIGKTWALIYDAETHNHGKTIYVRCSSMAGLHGLMNTIGARIGVSSRGSKDAMKQGMLAAFQPDMVLILDEFHELLYTYRRESFFACAEFVRELYDRIGMGIVLSLTNFGRDQIGESRKSDLEQIFRRGVHRIQVGTKSGLPLKEDIEMILERHGLEWPAKTLRCTVGDISESPRDVLHQLAKDEGLKAICERIRYAYKIARQQGRETITWEDVMSVHVLVTANALAAEDWS